MNRYRPLTFFHQCRRISTLPSHVHHFPDPSNPSQHILSLLSSPHSSPTLALGTTPTLPPSPSTFIENPKFLPILHSVLRQHAIHDPYVCAEAATYAAESGFTVTSTRRGGTSSGAGPTAYQGGSGGAGRGGWVHVSDLRRPPDWGRIADPEDIFGSVEVDGRGAFVGVNGNYQESGTYRIITRDGM
jgi:hypothetical protein